MNTDHYLHCAQYSNTTLLFRWHNQGLLFFLSKRDYWTNKYPVSLINVSHYRNKIGCHFMLTLYTCIFKQNDYLKVNISHRLSHYMRSSACVIIINIWRLLSFDISCQLSSYTHHIPMLFPPHDCKIRLARFLASSGNLLSSSSCG